MDDTDVSPELDWCQPPLCVLWGYSQDNPQLPIARPQPGDMYACGEASQERQEREAYRHLHSHIDFGPGEALSWRFRILPRCCGISPTYLCYV